jgi:hypothetical protein
MDEAAFLGGANNYIGLASLSIVLILTVLVIPVNRMSILLESLQAWQYTEVYVISLLVVLVAAWQSGPVSEVVINSYCDSLCNTFSTLVYIGILAEQDAQCFRVQASIESAPPYEHWCIIHDGSHTAPRLWHNRQNDGPLHPVFCVGSESPAFGVDIALYPHKSLIASSYPQYCLGRPSQDKARALHSMLQGPLQLLEQSCWV